MQELPKKYVSLAVIRRNDNAHLTNRMNINY